MRLILVLTLIVFALAAGTRALAQQVRPQSVYVAAGQGVEGITVGYSTKSSVVAKYGNEFDLIEHNKYSYEINYGDYGLSFWYRYGDQQEKIFAIAVKPKSHGFTGRGIVVGRSTLKDVFDVYGKRKLSTTSAEETWFVEYGGIAFHVAFKPGDYHKRDEKLLKRKIIEIEVLEVQPDELKEGGQARTEKSPPLF